MLGYDYVKDLMEMEDDQLKFVCTDRQAELAKDLEFDLSCGALLTDDMIRRIDPTDDPSSLDQIAEELSYRIIYYMRRTKDYEMYEAFLNYEIVDHEILEQLCLYICNWEYRAKSMFGERELKLFEILNNRYSYILMRRVDPNIKNEILKKITSMNKGYVIASFIVTVELRDVLEQDDVNRFDGLNLTYGNSLGSFFYRKQVPKILKHFNNPKLNMDLVKIHCRGRGFAGFCVLYRINEKQDKYYFVKDLTLDPEYNRVWREMVKIYEAEDFPKYKFPDNDQVKERINFILSIFDNLKHYIGRIFIRDIAPEHYSGYPRKVTFVDCILLDEILFKFIRKSPDEKLMDAYLAYKLFHEINSKSKD